MSVADEHHLGRLCTAISDAIVVHMEALIGEKRRISVDTLAIMLNISVRYVYGIIRETLKYHYLCSRWVLRQLTNEHTLKCVQSCSFLDTLPC
jgi:hypothetical protein